MGKHVLAIEDSAAVRKLVEATLRSHGLQVSTARDGREGLELMAAKRFDAVLLDLNMPVMDGMQLLEAIKADPEMKKVPVLVLTTEINELDRAKTKALGARHYMVKPFKPGDLARAVKKLLEQAEEKGR